MILNIAFKSYDFDLHTQQVSKNLDHRHFQCCQVVKIIFQHSETSCLMIPNCDWVIVLNFRGLLNCAIWMTQSYMFIVSTSLKMLVQLDRHQYHPKFVYLVTITYDKCFKTVLIGTVRERLQPFLPCDCFGQLTGHRHTYKLDHNCPYLSTSTLLLCSV